MTRESDAQLLAYIRGFSTEEAVEYFTGRRIVDQWGGDRGTITGVLMFDHGIMNYKTSEGDHVDFCSGLHVIDGLYYCCTELRGRIVLNDSGCYKCIHSCKMREPCVFMEEKE